MTSPKARPAPHRVWYRWIAPRDEEETRWREGPLAGFDPQRIAVSSTPASKRWRLEVHALAAGEGPRLVKQHGGWLAIVKPAEWQPVPVLGKPIAWRVNPQLAVVADAATQRDWQASALGRHALIVPAGMAFGTGEHATTGMMLRQLGRWAKELPAWRVLDAGTGSGILALAAHQLGARAVTAIDNDATAVRIARENEALNFSAPTGIVWRAEDLTRRAPKGRFDLILANLFCNVLVALAPAFTRLAETGKGPVHLAMSGLLGTQVEEIREVYRHQGWEEQSVTAKGKWRMMIWVKAA